jgi:NADH:ubiquinone oxidoreductase subunit D
MTHTIYVLESEVENLSQWMTDPESEDYARIKAQIAELKQAIAILKQHATKVPAVPPEFVRDYPNASD